MVEKTTAFEVVGLNEQLKKLESLLSTDPRMEEHLRGIIREVLKEARDELSRGASSGLGMKADPRQAYRAIKSAVYRQILGGNVSLLNKRKAGQPRDTWLPSDHTGRGGNRVKRSRRTINLQSYWGSDRSFILRFLNQGTDDRKMKHFRSDPHRKDIKRGSRGGDVSKYGKTVNTGARGRIAARNWFGSASRSAIQTATRALTARIEELIAERFNE